MSTSPKDARDDAGDKHEDELEEQPEVDGGAATTTPVKRGRGRPKGSKNKKTTAAPATGSSPAVPRKRGRPPKEKKEESGTEEPTQKRKRGRPPKVSQPDAGEGTTSGDAESSTKKKRGRPPKNAST